MGELLRQLARWYRRHKRIRVDLSVRMVQRDTHLDATVFEREHVRDLRLAAEFLVAIRPDVDQQLDMPERQRSQGGCSVLRKDHDLTDAERGLGRDGQ